MNEESAGFAPYGVLVVRLVVAALLGGAIGLERELRRKPAGLRTQMLTAMVAAAYVSLGEVVVASYQAGDGSGAVRADPLRIIQALVGGVSVICAGSIIVAERGEAVRGITTAVATLATVVIGIAAGLGLLWRAALITAVTLVLLSGVGLLERKRPAGG